MRRHIYRAHHIVIWCVNYCRYRVLTFHILFVLVINLSLIYSCCPAERETLMTHKKKTVLTSCLIVLYTEPFTLNLIPLDR
jgi:hypothetical protein